MRKSLSPVKGALLAALAVAASLPLFAQNVPAQAKPEQTKQAVVQKVESKQDAAKDAAKTVPTAVKDAAKDAAKTTAEVKEAAAPAAAAPAEKKEVKKEEKNPFKATFWALLPPLLAIILALITKEVYSSLFFGILLGGCFAANFAPLKTVDLLINNGLIEAVKATSGIFLFLVFLGAMVGLINRSGASAAFGKWAQTHVKSRTGAIFTTFLLGLLIFIDDYFNCLTVGSVMHPVTDAKKISRAKLAYIIDATAAPICMIAPISSWAAAVSQYVNSKQYSGLELFVKAIPYNFYSLLTILFLAGITLMKLDYGPMAKHEKNAMENGDLFSGMKNSSLVSEQTERGQGKVIDMLIPLILLVGLCVFALLYVGGILKGKDLVTAFGDTDAAVGLPWGALAAIILAIFYYGFRKVIPFRKAVECLPQGFITMVPAILILTLATSLKNMTELLHAKDFVSAAIGGAAPGLTRLLPVVIFLVACFLSFSTGSSWGTFGLLIPITIAVFPNTDPLFFVGISACLAGAVCGDHCSPISDTTIMSAAGAQCDLIAHTSTQLPYALTVTAVSAIGFLLAGFIKSWFIVFPITVLILAVVLCAIKFVQKSQAE